MEFKRFLLICYGWYYPEGGISDVEESTETEQEAMKWFDDNVKKQEAIDCPSISFQVFDCKERKVIAKWSSKN